MSVVKQASQCHVIGDKKELAALVSGARQEIVDVLSQMGTVSVAELARAIGRPPDAVYYHLRTLQRAGLIVSAGSRTRGRRQEQLFRTVSPDLRLEYRTGKTGNAREIVAIIGSLMRLGTRDFRHAFQRGNAKVAGPQRELWALRTTGWQTPAKIADINRSINSLTRAFSNHRREGRLYGITILLTPLDHRSRRSAVKIVSRSRK